MRQSILITLAAIIIAVLPISLTAKSDQNQKNRTLLMSIGETDYNIDNVKNEPSDIKSRQDSGLKDGITSETGEFIIKYDKPTGFSIYPDWELESSSLNLISGLFNFRPSIESESYIIKQQPAGAFTSEYSSRSKERFIEGIRFIQVNVFRDY